MSLRRFDQVPQVLIFVTKQGSTSTFVPEGQLLTDILSMATSHSTQVEKDVSNNQRARDRSTNPRQPNPSNQPLLPPPNINSIPRIVPQGSSHHREKTPSKYQQKQDGTISQPKNEPKVESVDTKPTKPSASALKAEVTRKLVSEPADISLMTMLSLADLDIDRAVAGRIAYLGINYMAGIKPEEFPVALTGAMTDLLPDDTHSSKIVPYSEYGSIFSSVRKIRQSLRDQKWSDLLCSCMATTFELAFTAYFLASQVQITAKCPPLLDLTLLESQLQFEQHVINVGSWNVAPGYPFPIDENTIGILDYKATSPGGFQLFMGKVVTLKVSDFFSREGVPLNAPCVLAYVKMLRGGVVKKALDEEAFRQGVQFGSPSGTAKQASESKTPTIHTQQSDESQVKMQQLSAFFAEKLDEYTLRLSGIANREKVTITALVDRLYSELVSDGYNLVGQKNKAQQDLQRKLKNQTQPPPHDP